jgi:BNR repeat protein
MNEPVPNLLPNSPLELIDAQTLFASGGRVRRHFGGLHTLPSGRMLLTFMFGTMPRTNDGGAMISRSDDHGRTWSEPMPLYAVPGWDCFPNGGACQITSDRARLYIGQYRFAPSLGGKQPFDSDWHTRFIDSTDDGAHWTEPSDDLRIFPGWTEFYGASNPIPLPDGRLLWAVQGTQDRDRDWRVGVSFSDSQGANFTDPLIYASDPSLAYSDADIVRLADGRLLTVLREHMLGGTFYCHSSDDGQTWTDLRPTGFIGANFKLHLLRSGSVLCLYRDEDPERYGVSLGVSHDEGETWEWTGSLYAAYHSTRHIPGYFCGCPDLVESADGNLAAVLHSYEDDDGEMCLHLLRLRDVS